MNELERDFRFEIVEEIGVISRHSTGWIREINLISWNGGLPKYDLRDWSPDHEYMSKGITLTEGEMQRVVELMAAREKIKNLLEERITEAEGKQEHQVQNPQKSRGEPER